MVDDADDQKARRDVERTIGEVARFLKRKDVPLDLVEFGDIDALPLKPGEQLVANVVIGMRGSLTRAECRRSAAAYRKLAARPNVSVAIAMAGWDEEFADLPEIPEAREYVRKWARFAGVDTLAKAKASPLHEASVGMIAACGGLTDVDPASVRRVAWPSTARH
jgi:hypothetical protein